MNKNRILLIIALLLSVTGYAQTASGPSFACIGLGTTFAGTPAGGTWSVASPPVGTIDATTGIFTGLSSGTTTITYTLPSSLFATTVVTVIAPPSPATISGTAILCVGNAAGWTASVPGGTWSPGVMGVVSVTPTSATTANVYGINAGTEAITYNVSNSGCTVATTAAITVYASAAISTAGSHRACVGSTIAHTAISGGFWSVTPSSVASVSSSGTVTGIAPGVAFVTYTMPTGCQGITVDTIVAVPSAISGPSTICVGTTATLTNSVPGGTWASSNTAVAPVGPSSGVVTGLAPGTATIYYYIASGCSVTSVVTITAGASITAGGPTSFCAGGTVMLSGTPTGGSWSVSGSVASVSGAGLVTGLSGGTAIVTYSAPSGCMVTSVITVLPSPLVSPVTSTFCSGTSVTATASPIGGTWSSSAPSVIAIVSTTGVMTSATGGSATITYAISSGCYATTLVTSMPTPVLVATATPDACGNGYTLSATGGTSSGYTWSSMSGLSCSSCASPICTPTATVTYTLTDYSPTGCGASTTVTVNGNRIMGHISFSGTAPSSPSLKVWLIQYNPADSSITGVDSVTTCMDGASPWYHFDGKPAGNYLVKARLNGAVPATSDYIPTYGASTPNWFSAATITHTAASDFQNINMLFGTVPAGPGFISGFVYSGAGKGTASEIPVEGMIVYLRNSSGTVLTYTYTDATGAYSFGSLAYGSYVIYPEDYSYYTTASAVITLSAANPSVTGASFKQYTSSGVILPYELPSSVFTTTVQNGISIYPNPASGLLHIQSDAVNGTELLVTLTDAAGRTMRTASVSPDAVGHATTDVSGMPAGVYILRITSSSGSFTGKLIIQ